MNKKGFVGLVEILIAVAIIGILMVFMLKRFAGGPMIDKDTTQKLSEQGIDTTSYKTIADTTKTSVEAIQEKQAQRLNEIMDKAANSSSF